MKRVGSLLEPPEDALCRYEAGCSRHRQIESARPLAQRCEAERRVEQRSLVVDRVGEDGVGANGRGRDGLDRVEQQRFPKALTGIAGVPAKPADQDGRNRRIARQLLRSGAGTKVNGTLLDDSV